MFKCAMNHTTKPGEKMTKLVIETRKRIYTTKDADGSDLIIGTGSEIVREVAFCPEHTPTVTFS